MATAVAATSLGEPFPVDFDDTDDDDILADELEAELVEAEERRGKAADASSSRTRKRESVPTVEATEARSAKSARRDERPPQPPGLATLPPELVHLVFRWLSPEDLTSVAQTCLDLRDPTMDDSLWRRCFCARFGHPKQRERDAEKRGETRRGGARGSHVARGGGDPTRGSTWRALYMADDAREMREVRLDKGPLKDIFVQAAAAKRSTPPGWSSLHTDDVLISTPTDTEAVVRWRLSRGLGDGSDPTLAKHRCSLSNGCPYHRVGADIFVCEATGRAHVCDEDCRERVVDMDGMSEMCCISGRSFDRMLPEGAEGMTGDALLPEDQLGEVGFLGKCFEAGYGADTEREMYATLWGGGECVSGGRLGDGESGDSSDSDR